MGCLHALGLVALRLEQPDEARACFERVIELQRDFAPALVGLGQALEASGRAAAAEARYQRALALAARQPAGRGGARRDSRAARRTHARRVRARCAVLTAQPNYPPAAMVAAEAEIALGEAVRAESRPACAARRRRA